MNAKDKKLKAKCIKHWRAERKKIVTAYKNVKRLEQLEIYADGCSFCYEYFHGEKGHCYSCPVRKMANAIGCRNTPYMAAADWVDQNDCTFLSEEEYKEGLKLFDAEIKFLKSL